MSESAASGQPATETLLDRPVGRLSPFMRHLVVLALGATLMGLLAGVLWHSVVDLPGYVLGDGGRASVSERGLAGWFTTDYWYSVIAFGGGLLMGVWAWWRLARRGWSAIMLVVVAALIAALLMWAVGTSMGPHDFDLRLAAAKKGDVVPIDFRLSAHSALLMWPLGAVTPIMLLAAFVPGEDDRALRRLRRRARTGRA